MVLVDRLHPLRLLRLLHLLRLPGLVALLGPWLQLHLLGLVGPLDLHGPVAAKSAVGDRQGSDPVEDAAAGIYNRPGRRGRKS